MSTLAHTISRILPAPVVSAIRPKWHRLRLYLSYIAGGGRLRYSRRVGNVVARKPLTGAARGTQLEVVIRSSREFRRFATYGVEPDRVYDWLSAIPRDGVLWDVGSSNGLEGFQAVACSGCQVIFVEPFTPSIESILKTRYVTEERLGAKLPVEVIHAACSDVPDFGRLITHTKPVPGETYNSIGDSLDDYCAGGRNAMKDSSSQWIKYVTLDELLDHGLPAPTHLKMDVDGFELRVLKGGNRVLNAPSLVSAAVEINDANRQPVEQLMEEAGFRRTDVFVHYESGDRYTADHFYTR